MPKKKDARSLSSFILSHFSFLSLPSFSFFCFFFFHHGRISHEKFTSQKSNVPLKVAEEGLLARVAAHVALEMTALLVLQAATWRTTSQQSHWSKFASANEIIGRSDRPRARGHRRPPARPAAARGRHPRAMAAIKGPFGGGGPRRHLFLLLRVCATTPPKSVKARFLCAAAYPGTCSCTCGDHRPAPRARGAPARGPAHARGAALRPWRSGPPSP